MLMANDTEAIRRMRISPHEYISALHIAVRGTYNLDIIVDHSRKWTRSIPNASLIVINKT
jgi:hypothetical protein